MNDQPIDSYHGRIRREVAALLPATAARVLEIGCGTGATLAWLRDSGRCQWTAGVEIAPAAAAVAATRLDAAWCADIETLDPPVPAGSLDAVLCLDVLEHMRDPWSVVGRLHRLLRPGGRLIASIPNVRYYKVSLPLLFGGDWTYRDAGVLDRTHLRFFVRRTAIELIAGSGLAVDAVQPLGLKPWKLKWLLSRLSFGALTGLLCEQYLIRAVRRD